MSGNLLWGSVACILLCKAQHCANCANRAHLRIFSSDLMSAENSLHSEAGGHPLNNSIQRSGAGGTDNCWHLLSHKSTEFCSLPFCLKLLLLAFIAYLLCSIYKVHFPFIPSDSAKKNSELQLRDNPGVRNENREQKRATRWIKNEEEQKGRVTIEISEIQLIWGTNVARIERPPSARSPFKICNSPPLLPGCDPPMVPLNL